MPPPLHILLIDDDEDSFVITRALLAQGSIESSRVEWVSTYEAGLAALRQRRHDACLLDYRLGALNGLELLRQAIAEGCNIPIIMLTGTGNQEVDSLAMRAGAADFLNKDGLTAALLERVVRHSIERRRATLQRQTDESHLRQITNLMPAVLWTTDEELRFTSSLGKGLLGLGLRPNEVLGKSLADYFQTARSEHPAIAAHRRALAGESVAFDLLWQENRYQAQVEPLCGVHGAIVGTIGVALDVSETWQLECELKAARGIQQHLLPKAAPVLAGFDIAGICRPAEATGGDFFDYVKLSDGSLGIIIADVSSHGFGPALIMAETRRVLRTWADITDDLASIVSVANHAVFEDTLPELFVTMFFAQLNTHARTLNYVGAGHEGYLLNAAGTVTTLGSSSFPLGLTDDFEIELTPAVALRPGDILVLLTDGFAEATAPSGEMFGSERALGVVQDHRDRPAAEILETLYQTVHDFRQSDQQHDDETCVIIKVEAGN